MSAFLGISPVGMEPRRRCFSTGFLLDLFSLSLPPKVCAFWDSVSFVELGSRQLDASEEGCSGESRGPLLARGSLWLPRWIGDADLAGTEDDSACTNGLGAGSWGWTHLRTIIPSRWATSKAGGVRRHGPEEGRWKAPDTTCMRARSVAPCTHNKDI